jgi:hypothetical protein
MVDDCLWRVIEICYVQLRLISKTTYLNQRKGLTKIKVCSCIRIFVWFSFKIH